MWKRARVEVLQQLQNLGIQAHQKKDMVQKDTLRTPTPKPVELLTPQPLLLIRQNQTQLGTHIREEGACLQGAVLPTNLLQKRPAILLLHFMQSHQKRKLSSLVLQEQTTHVVGLILEIQTEDTKI